MKKAIFKSAGWWVGCLVGAYCGKTLPGTMWDAATAIAALWGIEILCHLYSQWRDPEL